MNVSVSKTARWIIGHRGGELWVWTSAMGAGAMVHASTRAHDDRAFDRVDLADIIVWFEQGMAIDDVAIGWTPFTGFYVEWPGTISLDSVGAGG